MESDSKQQLKITWNPIFTRDKTFQVIYKFRIFK